MFKITPGRHEWRLWRPHLYEFAQLLFTERKPGGTRPQ
jgi:enterochelin esterase-like enzyme